MPDMPYFTTAEARAFENGKLSDLGKYTDAQITAALAEIEQAIERVCGHPFVPRSKTAILNGTGTAELALPDIYVTAITALTVMDSSGTTTTFGAPDLADLWIDDGYVRRRVLGVFTSGWGNVSVTYTYGEAAVPLPIKRAALILLLHRLIESDVLDRATSRTDEMGTTQLAVPTQRNPFGIPEVDQIIREFSDNRSYV